jgi:hypothetical protein
MLTRWVLVSLALAVVAGAFAYEIIAQLSHVRPLPAAPAPRLVSTAPETSPTGAEAVKSDQRPLYNVIAARTLFNPNRTEATGPAPGTAAAPPAPRPNLMGVVVDNGKSRAYLEDPATKKVFSYAVGDQVGGGRLEQIKDDRVVIARPEGTMEVMLRDPRKPRPAAPASPGPTPGMPAAPAVRPTGGPAVPGVSGPTVSDTAPPPAPDVQAAPPRTLQQLPPDFLRRRPAGPADVRPESPGG